MSNVMQSLYNIRMLDELAEKQTFIHRIHPFAKLMTTLLYIVVVVSFDKYDISGLLPFLLYPAAMIPLAELPAAALLKRLLWVLPFVLGIGIFNPLFDRSVMLSIGNIPISGGWISFFSILLKSGLTALAALILLAATGIHRIAFALEVMRVPRIFVIQLLLTYRYISVLLEEVSRILRGYSMRSPYKKGIHFRSWGSLAGQLLLRTLDRAQRVYQAMCCRGFEGEYRIGLHTRFRLADILFTGGWALYFICARLYNIPALFGLLMTGVIK